MRECQRVPYQKLFMIGKVVLIEKWRRILLRMVRVTPLQIVSCSLRLRLIVSIEDNYAPLVTTKKSPSGGKDKNEHVT